MSKKYVTTKAECESRIRGVCTKCGGKLTAIKTVNNIDEPTYWQGCEHCCCFNNGTSKKIFDVARKLVIDRWWRPYTSIEQGEEGSAQREYYIDENTGAVVDKIHLVFTSFDIPIFETALTGGEEE